MKRPRLITIKVITLFPKFVSAYVSMGILARAIAAKVLRFQAVDLRKFGLGIRKTVDDRPTGGGLGMLLRPDVLLASLSQASNRVAKKKSRIILLTPTGKTFTQKDARRLAKYEQLIFLAGRYEGFDERITSFVDEEMSIGDYVLMGGELPALVVTEAVLRLVPGVLGKLASSQDESFSRGILEYPQYTKPVVWLPKGRLVSKRHQPLKTPRVLLSGHHGKVALWRSRQAWARTKKRRPDLLVSR